MNESVENNERTRRGEKYVRRANAGLQNNVNADRPVAVGTNFNMLHKIKFDPTSLSW